jgi:hypothetical protein
MTHIIRLISGDKQSPTSTVDLTGSGLYLAWEGINPSAGANTTIYSGQSSRFDGQRRVLSSKDNTRIQLKYNLTAGSVAELRLLQRQINQFATDAGLYHEHYRMQPVYLEYRWNENTDLDDLPRPIWGQLNYYLPILELTATWPDDLHTGALIGANINAATLDIVGGPYWEGLEQMAGLTYDYANESGNDAGIKYEMINGELTGDFTIAGWITHDTSGNYAVATIYTDNNNGPHTMVWWDNSLQKHRITTEVGGSANTYTDGLSRSLSNGAAIHVSIFHDDNANTLSVYINGSEGPLSASSYTAPDAVSVLLLGSVDDTDYTSSSAPSASVTTSGLDAWRVWDEVLTDNQIEALYTVEGALKTLDYTIQYPLYCKVGTHTTATSDIELDASYTAMGLANTSGSAHYIGIMPLTNANSASSSSPLPWFPVYGVAGDVQGHLQLLLKLVYDGSNSDSLRSMWIGNFPALASYDPADIQLHQWDSDDGTLIGAPSSNGYEVTTTSSGAGTDTHTFTKSITDATAIAAMRGRYRVFAGVTADNDEATVNFTWSIGDIEIQQSTIEVTVPDLNGEHENFDFGEIVIDWPDSEPPAEINLNLNFTETSATATVWAADYVYLFPYPLYNLAISSAMTISENDNAIVINNRQAWVIDLSDGRREYTLSCTGDTLALYPGAYNYLFYTSSNHGSVNMADNQDNNWLPRIYHTPRWRLPGGIIA